VQLEQQTASAITYQTCVYVSVTVGRLGCWYQLSTSCM